MNYSKRQEKRDSVKKNELFETKTSHICTLTISLVPVAGDDDIVQDQGKCISHHRDQPDVPRSMAQSHQTHLANY